MDIWNVANITSIASAIFAGLAVLVAYLMWQSSARAKTKKDGLWEGEVKTSLKAIDHRLSLVEKQVSNFYKFLLSVFTPNTTSTQSPVQLNELVSEDINAKTWADKVSGTLKEKIKDKDAYEIQVFCFEYVESPDLFNAEEQRTIRDSAYNRGVNAFDVRRFFAIELRNSLLKEQRLEVPS